METEISTELVGTQRCKRCHRKLKDLQSIELGYGKVCYEKAKIKHINYLFELKENNYNVENI